MTLLWVLLSVLFALIAVVTIVDIVRNRSFGWATAGWIALVVILPFIGSLAYWLTRRTPQKEVEGAYLAQAEFRRSGRGPGQSGDALSVKTEPRDHF
jgi:hypothetical protein